MKNRSKIFVVVLAALLAAAVLLPALVSGTGISESDPIVALSYLNGTYKNDVLQQAQQQSDTVAASLRKQLETHAETLKASAGSVAADKTTHTVAAIPANGSYTVPEGAEFLLLSGTVRTAAAGLTDTTTGEAVAASAALSEKHLYVAASSVTLQADSGARILIRE